MTLAFNFKTNRLGTTVNAAGKIIGTVKLELEYASLRKEIPNIPFLNEPVK